MDKSSLQGQKPSVPVYFCFPSWFLHYLFLFNCQDIGFFDIGCSCDYLKTKMSFKFINYEIYFKMYLKVIPKKIKYWNYPTLIVAIVSV